MNIRDAGFWRDIEQIFFDSGEIGSWAAVSGVGQCTYPQLLDRLQAACRRAERNNNHVLLILVQLPGAERKSITQVGRLSVCLRASDSLCDLGAGRLALLIDDIHDSAVAPLVIERLISILTDITTGGSPAQFSKPCVGATLFPVEGISDEGRWALAESALNKAMEVGAGAYNLAPRVTGWAAMERFELGKDLHAAHRNNEFKLVYQPVVDLGDRRIHAVEVLLRWQHPVHGCLEPHIFLSLLEDSGLIVPVGERILMDACQFLATLRCSSDENFRACINISPRQLEDGGFLLSVLDALYDADLDPARLQLEFPESIVVNRSRLVQRVLRELHSAGVQLALDHFGAGGISLADLVRLPINLIKLDHSLIEHIVEDSVSQAIASGTLALAGTVDMQVAAVGVEQDLQNSLLEQLGCREAQGQYYSHPLSAAELCSVLLDTER